MSTEYQQQYDAEMARLEAGGEPITKEVKTDDADNALEVAPEVKELQEKLGKTEKALKDTQRWGHGLTSELAVIKRRLDEKDHSANRPAILDANPGLEDAIKHVIPQREQPQSDLSDILTRAIPDLNDALDDKDFEAEFVKVRDSNGGTWNDPLNAIRDITSLKSKFDANKAVSNAVSAAQKDFAKKQKGLEAMSVPGGSGGNIAPKEVDEVKRIQTMSAADFRQMQRDALGY